MPPWILFIGNMPTANASIGRDLFSRRRRNPRPSRNSSRNPSCNRNRNHITPIFILPQGI